MYFKVGLLIGYFLKLVLNYMNLLFQGAKSTIAYFISKLETFVRKLDIWMKNLESKQYGVFKHPTTLQGQFRDELFEKIGFHLKILRAELMSYFLS